MPKPQQNKRVNKDAITLLHRTLSTVKQERTFYAANPVMLKVIEKNEKVTQYLLGLCERDK